MATSIVRRAVDREGDEHIEAIVVKNYDGNPVITVFMCGYPVVVIEGDEYNVVMPTSSFHRQAAASLLHHLGDVSEDAYTAFVSHVGSPDEAEALDRLGEESQGYGICNLVDEVLEQYKESR